MVTFLEVGAVIVRSVKGKESEQGGRWARWERAEEKLVGTQ